MAPVRVAGRVSRLAEAAKDVLDRQGLVADDRDRPDLRVSDDRRAPDGLDASRLGERRDEAMNPAGSKVDRNQPRLEISRDKRDLDPCAQPG